MVELQGKFSDKLLEMYGNKCELLQISREMERVYDRIKKTMSPLQTGRLFCFLETYKFHNNYFSEVEVQRMYEELDRADTFGYDRGETMVEEREEVRSEG